MIRSVVASLLMVVGAFEAHAGPGPGPGPGNVYDLSWHTFDGGGGVSTGDGYVLAGTIAQPDAGAMASAEFTLQGGFWPGTGVVVVIVCPGDVNGDLVVDFTDLNLVLGDYGATGPGLPGDVDGDGDVDFADLNVVLSYYSSVCR